MVDDVFKLVRYEYLVKEISVDCFLFDFNYICYRLDFVRENLELFVLYYLILFFFYFVGVGGIKVCVKGWLDGMVEKIECGIFKRIIFICIMVMLGYSIDLFFFCKVNVCIIIVIDLFFLDEV